MIILLSEVLPLFCLVFSGYYIERYLCAVHVLLGYF